MRKLWVKAWMTLDGVFDADTMDHWWPPADEAAVDLTRESDDRDGIHHGVDESGDQVGGAGARSGAADTDLAGGARVAFGGEAGILFVANEDVLDVVVVEGIVEGDGDAAGVAKEDIDALANETFEQHFGAAHEFAGLYMFGRSGVWPLGSAGGMKVWGLHDFDLAPEKLPCC